MDNLILEWLRDNVTSELRNGNGWLWVYPNGDIEVILFGKSYDAVYKGTDLAAALAALAGE